MAFEGTKRTLTNISTLAALIHENTPEGDYHMAHLYMVSRYACYLNDRLGFGLDSDVLTFIAYAHDLLKERSLDPKVKGTIVLAKHEIPQDTRKYVRLNLDILDEYGIGDYFNTSMQYHSLAAGIFVHRELGERDPNILYPIFFHSCPIVSVYETLDQTTQRYVDVIMLADKLSSNYLKIHVRRCKSKLDLDLAVFGPDQSELNYSLGLVLARLITHGNSKEKQGILATKMYYDRLKSMYPAIPSVDDMYKSLGGQRKWPKRRNQLVSMCLMDLERLSKDLESVK